MREPRLALVTGANRGLGFEVSRQLVDRGYEVVLAGRDRAKTEQAAKTLGARASALTLDVRDAASARAAAAELVRTRGHLDVLVNNAGGNFDADRLASTVAMDFVRETLEMNLLGAWQMTQAMLPLLLESTSARIVNVSSGAGAFESGIAFGLTKMGGAAPAYAISKAALNALTVKLAAELRGTRILVNATCPGWTATYPGAAEQGARPVADGAASIVWGVTIADDGPSGGFFRDGEPIAW